MTRLKQKLQNYSMSDYYPFHMPGHKRNTSLMKMGNPYALDITEIDGFDNLHMANGILKQMMEEIASDYGARKSYLLINGSTSGILIGMAAATNHRDKVIMARNCHRAVYHGVYLNELRPVYLYPQEIKNWGISAPILAEDVDKALDENPDAKMVIITSPTYEGIVSDVGAIAKVVHQRKIPLMVDEAHGAHFGFYSYFPQNSITLDADIVIHSVHKTLPAFTQTALFHINDKFVDIKRVEQFFSMYQSSSPSYLLMMGIEESVNLIKTRVDLMEQWCRNLTWFSERANKLSHIRAFNDAKFLKDPSKIILSVRNTNMTGVQLYDRLREKYHLQMEAEYVDYVIAMTSMADTSEGFERLIDALEELDKEIIHKEGSGENYPVLPKLEQELIPYDADKRTGFLCDLNKSEGLISKEMAFLYPPGIPLIVPGEVISKDVLTIINCYKRKGLSIKGLSDYEANAIVVIGGKENG
ncbi:MAG: aminotransferase class I/II-fold pyridoxal phosphate-dependent enzyme [Velocimicrobium sp.]